jgi:hypothetical protein
MTWMRTLALWSCLWLALPATAQQAEPATESVTATGPEPATAIESEREPATATESEPEAGSEPEPDSATESATEPESEPEAGSEPEPDSATESATDPESATGVQPEPDAVRFQALAGLGVGSRGFSRPRDGQRQQLDESVFPAAGMALRAHFAPDARLSLQVLLAYQTSLGMTVEESPLFGLPAEIDARSERLELSAGPRLRLGDSPDAVAVALPVGIGMRAFVPAVRELTTPGYLLWGPQARAEIQVPLSSWLSLRAGPEVAWLVSISESLKREGVDPSGWALGLEAGVTVRPGAGLLLELSYRQSHARAGSSGGAADFEDVERYATVRLGGEL